MSGETGRAMQCVILAGGRPSVHEEDPALEDIGIVIGDGPSAVVALMR